MIAGDPHGLERSLCSLGFSPGPSGWWWVVHPGCALGSVRCPLLVCANI